LENKGNSQASADLKNLFLSEFPEFIHVFEKLSSDVDFRDMLADYQVCQLEIQKLLDMHSVEQIYIQLQGELKEEIINYIINHIKE